MACTALPHRHSFPQSVTTDFGGPNVEASPYPPTEIFRRLAASFVQLTGKPSRAFTWLSYSRPSHLTTVPGLVSPVRPVARREAPHAGQVARSSRELLSPLDGITRRTHMSTSPHPLCAMTARISMR